MWNLFITRKGVQILRLISGLVFLSCLVNGAQAEELNRFSDSWPRAKPPGDGYFSSDRTESEAAEDSVISGRPLVVYPYFEPQNISGSGTIIFGFEVGEPGYKLKRNDGVPGDVFYCEEAIWAARGDLRWASAVSQDLFNKSNDECVFRVNKAKRLTTHFACKNLFFEQYPNLINQVVVTHFIPPCCKENGITRSELHSLRNLKAIRLKDAEDPRLNELRLEWLSFLAKSQNQQDRHFTRQEVLTEADLLEKKYRSLFVDLSPFSNSSKKLWVGY